MLFLSIKTFSSLKHVGSILIVICLLCAIARQPSHAALAPLPSKWPTTFELGLSDAPGRAADLRKVTNFKFRYQYLAAGVNTGNGWANWNPNGDFAKYYIDDSVKNGFIPVFTYYMIFQSLPGVNMGEPNGVFANLSNVETMKAYYNDLKLFFQKAGAFPNTPVVLHVEPDMWGYIEQKSGTKTGAPVMVSSTGLPEAAGLPDTAPGLAQAIKKLRDKYAPNVLLGYHISIWGAGVDISMSDPSDSEILSLAQREVGFYKSLSTDFDLVFAEFSDRDAVYHQQVNGRGTQAWWNSSDYKRNLLFLSTISTATQKRIVLWQIPLGNTKMRAMNNTRNHYQDNRVEWFFDDPNNRSNLQEYVNAGVVAMLFGPGSGDVTCACDAAKDGVTNPNPINFTNTNGYQVSNNLISSQSASIGTVPAFSGSTLLTPYAADDDGGYFKWKAYEYYKKGSLALSSAPISPTISTTVTQTPLPTVTLTTRPSISVSPTQTLCSKKTQGDSNCDNSIDLIDFENFRVEYLAFKKGELNIATAKTDFNNDKTIDLLDFELFRQGFINEKQT